MTLKDIETSAAPRVWDIITKLAVALTIALTGLVVTHEWRIRIIEGNRFTQEDARSLFPPDWLTSKISDIQSNQKEIVRKLDALSTSITQLKTIHKLEDRE